MPILTYDDANMWDDRAGKGGATKAEWRSMIPRLREADKYIKTLKRTQGWLTTPKPARMEEIFAAVKRIKRSSKQVLVIGIGGSDLGARTLWQALGEPKKGLWVDFLSNPDPEYVSARLERMDASLRDTSIVVVSKSGKTLETLAIFSLVRERMKKMFGKKHADRVYVITDPDENPLHTFATAEGYTVIPHPLDVGGRFSVLTSVGLLPAACAGIDIKRLLKGSMDRSVVDAAKKFAALHVMAMDRGQSIHVLMPYVEALTTLGSWYRQLWAESLGKNGKGPTPVAGLGTIDQHSQIQLYNEGPMDKVVTFIRVETPRKDTKVPASIEKLIPGLTGTRLSEIMEASREGTASALAASGHPNGTLIIKSVTPESVGALLQFFMLATAYAGALMRIDAYHQPGVEAGKREIKRLLGI